MDDPLATYLQDHLAGAAHAIDLTERLRDGFRGQPLGEFAASLAAEIRTDRNTLEEIARRTGVGPSTTKEWVSRLGHKMSEMKLGGGDGNQLGTFESLEFLELGIHGKWALWKALDSISATEPRLSGFDFEKLAASAQEQRGKVEEWRVALAQTALRKMR